MNLLIDFYFLAAVPLLSRGWIVPVGGATPDRLQDRLDRLKGWLKLGPAQKGGAVAL